jgi:uncharacterized protein YaiI (UPF0178 family)
MMKQGDPSPAVNHILMRILVDADSCPVKEIIVAVAQKYAIPVTMFIDTAHFIDDGYSQVVVVDQGRDSVDFALVNMAGNDDIIVTGDYGVAAMGLAKGAVPLTPHGHILHAGNIDGRLFERYLSGKIRRGGGRTPNPRARRKEDNQQFEQALTRLCEQKERNAP